MKAGDVYADRADEYVAFIKNYCSDELARVCEGYPTDTAVFVIDVSDIYTWDASIVTDLEQYPNVFQSVFSRAVQDANTTQYDLEGIHVRFSDTTNVQSVPELLRGDHEGELVTLRGQVERVSEVIPRLTQAHIICENCSSVYNIPVPEHGRIGIDRCPDGDCGSKQIRREFDESEWHYHQLARIREPTEESASDAHIDVHLTKDAAGSVQSGERVDITGVLKAHFEDIDDPHPEFYMSGHSVRHHQSDYESIDTDAYKDEIKAYASGEYGDQYELLVDSIAPVIIDPEERDDGFTKLEAIKLAVGLQLFGGWRREISAGNYVRGDSHIALIGDPSTGKSQILDSANDLSPRSSYASGKNATKAGITAAAVRDDFGETEWSLDAGAIVNSHKGLCCIDEIDKVGGEVVSSLHSALEKQRLEINKAGIDATLKCETALLAAGNPAQERFIEEQANYTQLDIDPALYSRFDLVFTLSDDPDKKRDDYIAKHKIQTRNESGKVARGEKETSKTIDPAIPKDVLRAYIAYARQNVHPIITDNSVESALREYHTEIRQDSSNDAPITHRKLDALLRLCEASARVRLSEEITMQDVELVKDIVGVSLGDVGVKDGEFGEFAETVSVKSTDPQQSRVNHIQKTIEHEQKSISEIAEQTGYEENVVKNRIEKLQNKGDVIEPVQGEFRSV